MRHFKIKTLSVSGNGNKIYRLHDVVPENKLPSESIEGWLSDGGIEEIAAPAVPAPPVAVQPAKVEPPKPAEVILPASTVEAQPAPAIEPPKEENNTTAKTPKGNKRPNLGKSGK
jgi:hypothetical protein